MRYKKYNPQEFHGAVVAINYKKVSSFHHFKGVNMKISQFSIMVLMYTTIESLGDKYKNFNICIMFLIYTVYMFGVGNFLQLKAALI